MIIKYKDLLNYKSQYDYSFFYIKDVSRPSAVRFVATIGLNKYYEKPILKKIIAEVILKVRAIKKTYIYRTDTIDSKGGIMYERESDVVWVYLNPSEFIEKSLTSTWVARALWVTDETEFKGREIIKPKPLGGDDWIDDINIFWSWGVNSQVNSITERLDALNQNYKK